MKATLERKTFSPNFETEKEEKSPISSHCGILKNTAKIEKNKKDLELFYEKIEKSGINFKDIKEKLERHFAKEYYLFGVDESNMYFSKAPLRGNTPYGFFIDRRLKEITEEIKYFSEINETHTNMLNILLTINRDGGIINQLDTWHIFKKNMTLYITRVKRMLKERFNIEAIGHFRVFEAHETGHCHCHLVLILNKEIEYQKVKSSVIDSDRWHGIIKDDFLRDNIIKSWRYKNSCDIGISNVTAIYSTERLLNYLTKYYGKNQQYIEKSFDNVFSMNYDIVNDNQSIIKLKSDMKRVLGFYYSMVSNVRLFRHSIKKEYRKEYLDSMSNSLADETLNNVHEDKKEIEYMGVLNKKTLRKFCLISNYDEKEIMSKKGYVDGEDNLNAVEDDSFDIEKLEIESKEKSTQKKDVGKELKKEKEEVLFFKIDISNNPLINEYRELRAKHIEDGSNLSFKKFIDAKMDYCIYLKECLGKDIFEVFLAEYHKGMRKKIRDIKKSMKHKEIVSYRY